MEKSTHKKNFDLEHMSPQEQLKFEIAQELGLDALVEAHDQWEVDRGFESWSKNRGSEQPESP